MASSEKTQNLQLNKWLGNDSPKREDFNYDNERIDQAIKQTSEKIGILSELETSRKDSLVGAINEVKSSSDAKNVSLESPNFTSDNVQDGMNELFTFANSGKISIANAIGSPADSSDTFSILSDTLSNYKEALAIAVNNKKALADGYVPPNLGNATAGQVLSGATFSSQHGENITGTMINRGAVTNTITTQNGQHTIPQGYHSGSGKVTATFANLIASNIRSGVNIGGILGTLMEGTRIVTGSASNIGTPLITWYTGWGGDSFTTSSGRAIEVSINIGFVPYAIIIMHNSTGSNWRYYSELPFFNGKFYHSTSRFYYDDNSYYLNNGVYVSSTGFKIPVPSYERTYNFICIG